MDDANQIQVGQEALVVSYRNWGGVDRDFGWTVKRVTPSGQVVVGKEGQTDRRFDARLREIGKSGSLWAVAPDLCLNVAEHRAVADKERLAAEAASAINAVRCEEPAKRTWPTESLRREVKRLRALLDAADAAVKALEEKANG